MYIENIKTNANQSSFAPNYGAAESNEIVEAAIDEGGSFVTRATTLTDEGTYRINFANTSLAVAIGTITSIVGKVITGTGFNSVDVHLKDYFKLDADPESSWEQIASIDSDTQITLYATYVGGTSGLASRSLVEPRTGAGASITVLNGQGIIAAGTTSGAVSFLNRAVDYAPLVFRTRLSISQRIVNQNIRIGFSEASPTPKWFARFRCDGAVSTVNTTIICESARNPTNAPSVSETETTSIVIPNGGNTSQFLEYRIEHLVETVKFYINNILVAEHTRSLPSPYDYMGSGTRVENTGVPASNTNITIDYVTTKNHNKLEIGVMSGAEQIQATQVPLTPFTFTQVGVIPTNTDLMVIDCSQLRSLFIQCASIGTAGVITGQWSNDPTLVARQNGQLFDPIGGGIAGVFNTTVLRITNVIARYFILRLTTATTAGTTTLLVNGSQSTVPTYVNTQPITGTVTANIGSGAISAGVNAIGDVGTQYRANATGASSRNHLVSAGTTNATIVKASAGRLLGWQVTNTNAAFRYVKLHNQTTAPTAGIGVVQTIGVPPNATINFNMGGGIAFTTGIGMTTVTGAIDTDATPVGASDLIIDLFSV